MDRDCLRLAGLQVDAVEGGQGMHGKVGSRWRLSRCPEINLRHFVAGDAAVVFDFEADIEASVAGGRCFQSRVGKGGVGQSVSKGKERVDLLFVEPPIPDMDAFAEGGRAK